MQFRRSDTCAASTLQTLLHSYTRAGVYIFKRRKGSGGGMFLVFWYILTFSWQQAQKKYCNRSPSPLTFDASMPFMIPQVQKSVFFSWSQDLSKLNNIKSFSRISLGDPFLYFKLSFLGQPPHKQNFCRISLN